MDAAQLVAALRTLADLLSRQQALGNEVGASGGRLQAPELPPSVQDDDGSLPAEAASSSSAAMPSSPYAQPAAAAAAAGGGDSAAAAPGVVSASGGGALSGALDMLLWLGHAVLVAVMCAAAVYLITRPAVRSKIRALLAGLIRVVTSAPPSERGGGGGSTPWEAVNDASGAAAAAAELTALRRDNASLKASLDKVLARELGTRQQLLSVMDERRRVERRLAAAHELDEAQREAQEKLAAQAAALGDVTAYAAMLEAHLATALAARGGSDGAFEENDDSGRSAAQRARERCTRLAARHGATSPGAFLGASALEEVMEEVEIAALAVERKDKQLLRAARRVEELQLRIRELDAEVWHLRAHGSGSGPLPPFPARASP